MSNPHAVVVLNGCKPQSNDKCMAELCLSAFPIHWSSREIPSFSIRTACLLPQCAGSCLISLKNNYGKTCFTFPNRHALLRPIWWAKKFLTWKIFLSCRCLLRTNVFSPWNYTVLKLDSPCLSRLRTRQNMFVGSGSQGCSEQSLPWSLVCGMLGPKCLGKNPVWAQLSVRLLTDWNQEVT